jgi:hypothetical protein
MHYYKHKEIEFHVDNPNFLFTQLTVDSHTKDQMKTVIENEQDTANYHGGYTFEIEDKLFEKLYNTFTVICQEIFGELHIFENNRRICWANVYNCDSYRSNLHHHLRTSTINSVFYLNIPADDCLNSSGLRTIYNNNEYIFLPDELDLVIMPSWMPHEPLPHNSKENRIAINMELQCGKPINDIYTLTKIYEKCKIII